MWVKLGEDYLNLNQVVRVRFSRGWKSGHEEVSAEVEAAVNGVIQGLTRYRGREAEALQAVLGGVPTALSAVPATSGPRPARDTLHEV
jgi:hypothetical protein